MLKAAGEDPTLIGKVLNHSQLSTTAIYARLNLDPVRKALDAHATQLKEMLDNHSTGDEREALLHKESA
jgi:site-specific recombinase XerC